MASKELRAKLRERFPADEVKQREGPGRKKLDYVAIETVLARLLDATADEDTGYAWQVTGFNVDKQGDNWAVTVAGNLMIAGDMGGGIGSMVNRDLDMACKSANSEAIKNAAKNGFGVGLELWDAEYRDSLAQRRRLLAGDAAAKKQAVFKLAKDRLGVAKPSVKQVADLFGVTQGALQEDEVLDEILTDAGLL